MGSVLCCDDNRHPEPPVKSVVLVGYDNTEVAKFDNIMVIETPRDYDKLCKNEPELTNESCILISSAEIRCQQRTCYNTTHDKWDSNTVLFCKEMRKRPTSFSHSIETTDILPSSPTSLGLSSFVVNDQKLTSRRLSNISTESDSDIAIECRSIPEPVARVNIEYGYTYC